MSGGRLYRSFFGLQRAYALRAKFVLLNLQRQIPAVLAGYAPACDQIEQALLIQLRRPANRYFKPGSHREFVIGRK